LIAAKQVTKMLLTDDVHYTEHIAEHPEERRIPSSTSTVYLTPFTLIRKSIGFPTIAIDVVKKGRAADELSLVAHPLGALSSLAAIKWAHDEVVKAYYA
jgi:hypothetical protein